MTLPSKKCAGLLRNFEAENHNHSAKAGGRRRKAPVFVVVAYDIASDRRRNRLVKILKGYGVRVNFSVFECSIDRDSFEELKTKVATVINKKKDSVLYYRLCQGCTRKKASLGATTVCNLDNIVIR